MGRTFSPAPMMVSRKKSNRYQQPFKERDFNRAPFSPLFFYLIFKKGVFRPREVNERNGGSEVSNQSISHERNDRSDWSEPNVRERRPKLKLIDLSFFPSQGRLLASRPTSVSCLLFFFSPFPVLPSAPKQDRKKKVPERIPTMKSG